MRYPKPTALKLLTGNPGKRRITKNEPKPTGSIGEPPGWMLPEAKRAWHEIVAAYAGSDVLTALDRSQLTVFCQMFAEWMVAERSDTPLNAAFISTMMKIGGKLGLNPSDRTRLQVTVSPPVADPFDDLLDPA
jgi:phage terminase small subunit